MTKMTRCFCWHKNFVPKGLSAPGTLHMYKIMKKKHCIKSDFKEIFFKLAINEWSDETFLLTSNFCPPRGCLPLPRGYIYVLNQEKKCVKSDFKDIFLKLETNEWSDKTFLLTSKLCPLGAVCPCPRLYTWIKSWKTLYKIRLQRDFFKLAANEWSDKTFLLT